MVLSASKRHRTINIIEEVFLVVFLSDRFLSLLSFFTYLLIIFSSEYPVSEPIPKLSSKIQASGEAKYTVDEAPLPGTLYASFVTSSTACATISSIDASAALQCPGVVGFYCAKDIPEAKNKWGPEIQDEEIFASTQVAYYGQCVGMILADTQAHADFAALQVVVNFTNVQTPILTLEVNQCRRNSLTFVSSKCISMIQKSMNFCDINFFRMP